MHEDIVQVFFKLIRISLGESTNDFPILNNDQWRNIYTLSRQQAILGVVFSAVKKLPEKKTPPRELTLKWIVATEQIKQRNRHLDKIALKIETLFNANNFISCILKGPGMAQLYPNPELRVSGDIDVWINGDRRDIISFVRNNSKSSQIVYHHIDGLKIDDIDVEIHFIPSYMANPFANNRLQQWMQDVKTKQFNHSINICGGKIHTPTLAFNRVFILHHIYRHFFYEGVGLRQMMDFYYVLKQGFTKEEQEDTQRIYKKLNLLNFAGATVYVLREIFGLEEELCIVPPNENYGMVLLSEIIGGGNFGQIRFQNNKARTKLRRGLMGIKRSIRFIIHEPLEVIWLPYFKMMNNLLYVRCIQ